MNEKTGLVTGRVAPAGLLIRFAAVPGLTPWASFHSSLRDEAPMHLD
jgi:hypothetical protein